LIAGIIGNEADELYYFSNRGSKVRKLKYGIYGLSNHLLDTPWPKVRRGKDRLAEILESEPPRTEMFFKLLADKTSAPVEELPDTGIGYEIERSLSPIFIETPAYGTRSSTVVRFQDDGVIDFEERVVA
jgi:uncharacterized protein with NRDE domain